MVICNPKHLQYVQFKMMLIELKFPQVSTTMITETLVVIRPQMDLVIWNVTSQFMKLNCESMRFRLLPLGDCINVEPHNNQWRPFNSCRIHDYGIFEKLLTMTCVDFNAKSIVISERAICVRMESYTWISIMKANSTMNNWINSQWMKW